MSRGEQARAERHIRHGWGPYHSKRKGGGQRSKPEGARRGLAPKALQSQPAEQASARREIAPDESLSLAHTQVPPSGAFPFGLGLIKARFGRRPFHFHIIELNAPATAVAPAVAPAASARAVWPAASAPELWSAVLPWSQWEAWPEATRLRAAQ